MKKFLLLSLLLITASLYSVTSSLITSAKSAKTLPELETICEQKNSLTDLDKAATQQFIENYGTTPSAACASLPDLNKLNAMPVTDLQEAIDFLEACTQLAKNNGPTKLIDQKKYTSAKNIIDAMPSTLATTGAITAKQQTNLNDAISYLQSRAAKGAGNIPGFTYNKSESIKYNIRAALKALSNQNQNLLEDLITEHNAFGETINRYLKGLVSYSIENPATTLFGRSKQNNTVLLNMDYDCQVKIPSNFTTAGSANFINLTTQAEKQSTANILWYPLYIMINNFNANARDLSNKRKNTASQLKIKFFSASKDNPRPVVISNKKIQAYMIDYN